MYQIPTFAMHHPEHGECVADETCESELQGLGWTREIATGSDDSDKGLQDDEAEAPAKGAKAKGAKA